MNVQVCGANNVTYSNTCNAGCTGVTVIAEGECTPLTVPTWALGAAGWVRVAWWWAVHALRELHVRGCTFWQTDSARGSQLIMLSQRPGTSCRAG